MYNVAIKSGQVIFSNSNGSGRLLRLSTRDFADFCGYVSQWQMPRTRIVRRFNNAARNLPPVGENYMHLHLWDRAGDYARETAREALASFFSNRYRIFDDVHDRQRLDVESGTPALTSFLNRIPDFVSIPAYTHSFPLVPESTLSNEEYSAALIKEAQRAGMKHPSEPHITKVFANEALGFKPAQDGDNRKVALYELPFWFQPRAVAGYEDRGDFRLVHPAPLCFPDKLRAEEYKALRAVATPLTMKELDEKFKGGQAKAVLTL